MRLYQRFGTDFHQCSQENFSEIFEIGPYDRPSKWLPGEGRLLHHREGQVVSAACPSCHLGGYMKIINLRLSYPHYEQDKLVEASEEVFDALCCAPYVGGW